jgi:uncharacterized protein (TIGR03083 family)
MSTAGQSTRVNVLAPDGKEHLLRVVEAERAAFTSLVEQAGDAGWEKPTPCTGWQVRDLVGHMIDVTEAYLERFEMARAGQTPPDPLGLQVMAQKLDEGAKRFRSLSRAEAMARLKRAGDDLFGQLHALSGDEWSGFLPAHVYIGPVPASFFAAFQLMDFAVHGWDAREALGKSAPIPAEAADTLVPFMFILLQATVDVNAAAGVGCTCGIRVSDGGGGSWRVTVGDGALAYEEGSVDDCAAVFDFDGSDFVLTSFQRVRGGRSSGDQAVADIFRGLFFKI